MKLRLLPAAICLAGVAVAQNTQTSAPAPTTARHEVGTGGGDIGKGAAKGAGSAAKGTAKAAGGLVTLHPVNAAADVGKGAANAGKNVGVGAVKGTAKIAKGAAKAIGHLF